jgi:hypothetical protein
MIEIEFPLSLMTCEEPANSHLATIGNNFHFSNCVFGYLPPVRNFCSFPLSKCVVVLAACLPSWVFLLLLSLEFSLDLNLLLPEFHAFLSFDLFSYFGGTHLSVFTGKSTWEIICLSPYMSENVFSLAFY